MPDRLIPLSDMDHAISRRNIIVSACFIVKGRLDTDILHDSLEELVTRWPVLSARLSFDKASKRYALLIPHSFPQGRKHFIFTTDHTNVPYPRMPSRKAGLNPDMQTRLADFSGPSTPVVSADILKVPDTPVLSVHAHYFADVTCIGFHLPHIFADVPGIAAILRAWCALMAGYPNMGTVKVQRVIEGDAIGSFGETYPKTQEGKEVFHREMTSSSEGVWGLWARFVYQFWLILYIMMSKEQARLLFIPQSVVDQHRKEAMDKAENVKWVSENDVVTALLVKLHLFNRLTIDQLLTLTFSGNLRKQIPSLSDPDAAYLHNCTFPMSADPMTIRRTKSMSVAELALFIRHTIEEQRPIEQITMSVALHRELARQELVPCFGPAYGTNFYVTSWAVAKWGDLDFSGALSKTGDIAPGAGTLLFANGTCIYLQGARAGRSGWSIIMAKMQEEAGSEAGYWCELGATAKAWPEIEKALESWAL